MMDDFDQDFDLKKKNSLFVPKTSDKRREISRDAARQRRNNESDIFLKLQEVVPIVDEPKVSHVDRIALLRLAANYIRFRHIASKILTDDDGNDRKPEISIGLSDCFCESKIGELLNGFLLIVDSPGYIIYASASVSKYLGVTQTDLVGHNLSEFLKDEDVKEMLDVISRCQNNVQEKTLLRMKSVLGARGRSLNLRSALYKTISFSVVKRYISMDHNICDLSKISLSSSSTASSLSENQTTSIIELKTINNAGDQEDNSGESMRTTPDIDYDNNNNALVVESGSLKPSELTNNENISVKCGETVNCGKKSRRKKQRSVTSDGQFYFFVGSPMNQCGNSVETNCSHVFVTRHSMDMKFSYCHEKLTEYLGYDVKALTGLSFYSLVHPSDLRKLQEDFKQIYQKQQITTGLYRIMAEEGGYVWLSTEATIVTQGARSGRGQHIVCVHQVVSATTTKEILADVQKQINTPVARQRPYSDFEISSSNNANNDDNNNNNNTLTKSSNEQKEIMNKYYTEESANAEKNRKLFPFGNRTAIFDDLSSLPIFELDDAVGINYEPWLFRDNGRQRRMQGSVIPTERFFPSSTAPVTCFAASTPQRTAEGTTATSFAPSSVPMANATIEKFAHGTQPVADAAMPESLADRLGGTKYFGGTIDSQFARNQREFDGFAQGMGSIQNDVDKTCRASVAHSGTDYDRKTVGGGQYGNGRRQICNGDCRGRSEYEHQPQVRGWNMATPYFKETPCGVRYHSSNEQCPNGNAKTVVEPVGFVDHGNDTQSASTNTSTDSTNTEILPTDRMDPSRAQPSTDGGSMYTALSNASFLSTTNELNEKVDELTSLAPFVDTGELVNLDISAGELDIPLDFGDFQEMTMDAFDPENKCCLNCDSSTIKSKEKSGQKSQLQQPKSCNANDQWIYEFLLNENHSNADAPVAPASRCVTCPTSSSSLNQTKISTDQNGGYVWSLDSPIRHDPGASVSSVLFRDTCVSNSDDHVSRPKVVDSESSVDANSIVDSKSFVAKLPDDQTSAVSGDKNSLNDSFGSTSSLFQEFGDFLYPPNYDLCDANNYLIADALLSSSDVKLTDAATTNRDRKESESATTSLTNNFNTIDDLEMFFNNHDSMSNSAINSDNNMWTLDAHFNQNAGLQYPLSAEQQHLSPVKNGSSIVVDEAGHGYARSGEQSSSTDRYSFVPKPLTEYEIQSETSSKMFQSSVNVQQNDDYAKSVAKTISHGVKAYASPSPYAAQKHFSPPAVPSSSSATLSGQQQLQARFAPGFNINTSLQNGGGIGRSMTNLASSSTSNPIVRGISASYTNVYPSISGPNRSSMPMGRKRPINPIKVREVKRPYSVAPYGSQSTSFSNGFGFNVSGKNVVPPGISCYPPTSSTYSNTIPTQVPRQFTPPGIRTITGNVATSGGVSNNNVNGISSYDSSYKNKGISTFPSTKRMLNQNNDDYVPEKVMKISYVTPITGGSKYVFGNGLALPNNNNNAYPAARQQQHIIISAAPTAAPIKSESPLSSSAGTTIKMKRLAPMVNGISVVNSVNNGASSVNANPSSYSSFDQQVFSNTSYTVTAV